MILLLLSPGWYPHITWSSSRPPRTCPPLFLTCVHTEKVVLDDFPGVLRLTFTHLSPGNVACGERNSPGKSNVHSLGSNLLSPGTGMYLVTNPLHTSGKGFETPPTRTLCAARGRDPPATAQASSISTNIRKHRYQCGRSLCSDNSNNPVRLRRPP